MVSLWSFAIWPTLERPRPTALAVWPWVLPAASNDRALVVCTSVVFFPIGMGLSSYFYGFWVVPAVTYEPWGIMLSWHYLPNSQLCVGITPLDILCYTVEGLCVLLGYRL